MAAVEIRLGAPDPGIEFRPRLPSDHRLEMRDDFACIDQNLDAAPDRGHGYGPGFGRPVAPVRHQPSDGSGGGSAAHRARIHLFGSPAPKD